MDRKDLGLGLFFSDRMSSYWENGFHICNNLHRTITDRGISLLLWLWQEEGLLPPSSGQILACPSVSFITQPAWIINSTEMLQHEKQTEYVTFHLLDSFRIHLRFTEMKDILLYDGKGNDAKSWSKLIYTHIHTTIFSICPSWKDGVQSFNKLKVLAVLFVRIFASLIVLLSDRTVNAWLTLRSSSQRFSFSNLKYLISNTTEQHK